METQIDRRLKIVLYVLGVAALLLFVIKFFSIDVPFITSKSKTGEVQTPAFDITGICLLIAAIALFYHDRTLLILDNIKITKIKVSEVELQLDSIHSELKAKSVFTDENYDDPANNRNGLLLLLQEKMTEVETGIKEKFELFEAKIAPATLPVYNIHDSDFFSGDAYRAACLLCAYDESITADFLAPYVSMLTIQANLSRDATKVDDTVLIKAIGVTMTLLKIVGAKKKDETL